MVRFLKEGHAFIYCERNLSSVHGGIWRLSEDSRDLSHDHAILKVTLLTSMTELIADPQRA